MTFEQMIENVEMAVEGALRNEEAFRSDKADKASVLFDRLTGVQNAIDDWRQG